MMRRVSRWIEVWAWRYQFVLYSKLWCKMLWQLKPVCKWTRVWCDSCATNIQLHNNTIKIEVELQTQLLGAPRRMSHVMVLNWRCVFLVCHFHWGYKKTFLIYPQPALAPFLGTGFMGHIPVHPYFSLISRVILHLVRGSEMEDKASAYLRCWPTYSLTVVVGRGIPDYFKECVLLVDATLL